MQNSEVQVALAVANKPCSKMCVCMHAPICLASLGTYYGNASWFPRDIIILSAHDLKELDEKQVSSTERQFLLQLHLRKLKREQMQEHDRVQSNKAPDTIQQEA